MARTLFTGLIISISIYLFGVLIAAVLWEVEGPIDTRPAWCASTAIITPAAPVITETAWQCEGFTCASQQASPLTNTSYQVELNPISDVISTENQCGPLAQEMRE